MSYSDTKKAQLYAAVAEVAAAECKLYTEEARKAPDYAAEARQAANDAASSSAQATVAASQANISENSASESASQALVSASEAASAAQTASEAVFRRTLRVPDGETVTELQAVSVRKDSVASFDDSGNPSSIPVNTIAILDSGGKIPVSMLPAIALTEPFVVNSQAAMLDLNAEPGDIAKRTDKGYSFMLAALPPSTLANWVQLNDDILAQLALSTGSSQVGALDDSGGSTTVQGALNLKASIASLASVAAGKGDSLLGVKQPYTNSVAMTQHDKNSQTIHVADFGAIGNGVANDAPAINAAISWMKANGGGTLLFGVGTYLCGSAIDLKGAYISLSGAGFSSTIIKAGFSGTILVDLAETTDSRISPIMIENMTINGNATVAYPLSLRFRHYTKFKNVLFTGGGSASYYAKDAWLNSFDNCGFESSPFTCHLDGSNHRTQFNACSFQGATNRCLVVRSNGTSPDGNGTLQFNNCDFEFATAAGVDFDGTDAVFNCCYMGENLSNSVFLIANGTIRVIGGTLFFGYTANTYLAFMNGGRLVIEQSVINGQTSGSIATLGSSSGGKFALKECTCNFPIGGTNSIAGDALLSGLGIQKTFAPRLGIDYASYTNNTTITDTPSGNQRTVTCVTAPGPSPVFGLRATLADMQWRDGEKWAVVVTYSSNVDVTVRVASTPLGSGTNIGTLSSTGGSVRTAILYGTTANRTTATVIEIFRDGTVSAGHTFTLKDISFGDSRALGADFGGSFGNLYKF
ncbi:hypothetical protein GW221_12425 [Escherichia coli]|uniref:glycoside hydrolase family 55 protein n=2 Tax=Escherichia coli TaxID=562 RepID=UPI001DFA464D|nr:glycoside hydrolase family 55 protein [Escherichia coli]EGZ6657824.1 hypothetical protein [Escherichia coli]MCI4562929.1 glycoside hydrolase family 55 protein [Escherichia coli]HBK0753851.1 hypothetical protein [Escherichia coli]